MARSKLKDTRSTGRGLITLASIGSWAADKTTRLATYERDEVTLTLDGSNFPTFTPFSERSYRRNEPKPIPDLTNEALDVLPDDVLLGLTFAALDEGTPCVTDGYFYFNGSTAVALTHHRVYIVPCELPLLAERTKGAFAAVPRLAFTVAMLQVFDQQSALSQRTMLPGSTWPVVRFGYDDIESTLFVNTSSSFTTTHAVVGIRCEQEWFDFGEVLDAASIEPTSYARVARGDLVKAKRMSAPMKDEYDTKTRKALRDKQEKAGYTLLVSTPQGLTVSGVESTYSIRKEENFGFEVVKEAVADEGFRHAVRGEDLLTLLLLDKQTTFGVGTSEQGRTCLVFELPSDGRLMLPAARISMTAASDHLSETV